MFGLYGIMWHKMGGKISLRSGHFDIWFLEFQQIDFCLPYSTGWVEKWIYKGNVFLFAIPIFFWLSYLGILSAWSKFLLKFKFKFKILP